MDRPRIARAAVVIMLGNLVTSALGFVRQFVTARYFGAGSASDAWFAAYTVPQMFYDLVIGGAISAALIPSFTRLFDSNRPDFWRTVGSIFVLAALVLLFLVGVLEIAAHPLMLAIASGFAVKDRGATLNLSVRLVRVILPTLFFWGLSAVSLACLYSIGRRIAASFATACFHLGIIVAAVILASPLGIIALPIGAVAGAASQFLVQVPSLIRARRDFPAVVRPVINLRDPAVLKILLLYGPVAIGIMVSIAGQIADINLKSHLSIHGGLSDMQYATTLIQFPVGIIVAALGLAVLPLISSDAAAGRMEDLKDKLGLGFRLVLLLMIPSAIGFLVLGQPIVALLFQHGRFTHISTVHTTSAILGYAPQLPFIGIDQLLIFAFYARHNTVTPMLAGVIGVVVYVGLALLLIGPLAIFGLAIANTVQIAFHACMLAILLLREVGLMAGRRLLVTGAKVIAGSLIMGLVVRFAATWIGEIGTGRVDRLAVVIVPLVVGVAVYALLMNLLRVEEVGLVRTALARRLMGPKLQPE